MLGKLITPEVEEMLRTGDYTGFRALSEHIHPADMAEIIESVPPERHLIAFLAISRELQPDVFEYLSPDAQAALLHEFKPEVLSRILNDLSDDVRTDLLVELPGQVTRRLLESLDPSERQSALALLGYPPESAGRLMTPQFLHVKGDATAAEVLDKVRRLADDVETVYVISVKTTDDREDVLVSLRDYDLLAVPVVDSQEKLVGIVTFDDLSDVAEEEATEDILKMHGVATAQDDYFSAGYAKRFRSRVVWLIALAVVGTGSVLVQQAYNPIIAQLSLLAAYISLLTASGGNVGTQSAGILIRAISTDEVDGKELLRIFFGEVIIGVALALTLSIIATILVFTRGAEAQVLGGHSVGEVAIIVGVSMFMAVVTTNTLGAAIPLIMRKIGVDPAVTAGPFITTAADILTVLVYFNIAQAVILS